MDTYKKKKNKKKLSKAAEASLEVSDWFWPWEVLVSCWQDPLVLSD